MQKSSNASFDKLRGGFYTPKTITDFIVKWGLTNKQFDILEPSSGDGAFLRSIKDNDSPYKSLTAVELIEEESLKCEKLRLLNSHIINMDFLSYVNTTDKRFDVVIGNPPYIRYQYFKKEQQDQASLIFEKAGLKFSRLTNAWVPFVIGSSLLLKDRGKIAFVIPAELLQVSYAQKLRKFLASYFNVIQIISFRELVFPEVQQEVVILLCQKNGSKSHLINHVELQNESDLINFEIEKQSECFKNIDFNSKKWTYYFLNKEEIELINRLSDKKVVPALNEFADIEVGITTGDNNFFTVSQETVEEFQLYDYVKPMVGRSIQVPSINFSIGDWNNNNTKQLKSNLVIFPSQDIGCFPKLVQKYMHFGMVNKVHERYKTSIRNHWYSVPSIRLSEGLLIRRNNAYPRLILNEAETYTTDTMHRVYIKKNVNKKALIASFYNSLSLAFSEIVGRSYGGGVLELMPSESGQILVPYSEKAEDIFNEIDRSFRVKEPIDKVLDKVDELLLIKEYKLSEEEVAILRGIWRKLSFRRLNRGSIK